MNPRVSVVIPAYNSVAFIGETVRSVLQQTFPDFELVISDHSSTDGTWEALQAFADDPRVRLSRLPTGGGAPANWNAVTEQATGELIKLVCGDDLIYPTCLADQVAALGAHPTAVLAASSRDILDAAGRVLVKARGLTGLTGVVPGRAAIRQTVRAGTNIFGEPASVLMRRDALTAAGNWDGAVPYLIDEATYVAVLFHGDLVTVPGPLAGFRVSDQQWSVRLMRSQASQATRFHRLLGAAHPGLLSTADLRRGAVLAQVNALLRRAAYVWLGRRMRATPHTDIAEPR